MKLFLYIWLAVMIMDNMLPFLLARYYKGYDHKGMVLSVLGCKQSPVKWQYNIWCIFSGLVFVMGGVIMHSAFSKGISAAICVLVVLYGLGCEIFSGIFSFFTALTFFVFFIMGEKEKFSQTVLRYGGLWQRMTLVFCYLPFLVFVISKLL